MEKYDTVIENGTIVTGEQGRFAGDVAINEERIAAIGYPKTLTGKQQIDATGKHVLPGVIDPHTHHGIVRDIAADAKSESRSDLVGGVTTTGNMVITDDRRDSWSELVPQVYNKSSNQYYHDYYINLAPLHEKHVEEIPYVIGEFGIVNFKWFNNLKQSEGLTEDIADSAIQTLAEQDISTTLGYHSENTEITQNNEKRLRDENKEGYNALLDRFPGYCEAQSMVAGAALAKQHNYADSFYIVHVSSKETITELQKIRNAGYNVKAETCPHYLTHTSEISDDIMKINPPIRKQKDQDSLWDGIKTGIITNIGSDHCAKPEKVGSTIWESENAFPGSATILPVVLSEGYHKDRLSLKRAVELTSTNNAKTWNLYPQKGTIQVGSDADLLIVDLEKTRTVSSQFLKGACDYSIYDGWKLTGWPTHTIVRGEVAYANGEITGTPGHGTHINLKP